MFCTFILLNFPPHLKVCTYELLITGIRSKAGDAAPVLGAISHAAKLCHLQWAATDDQMLHEVISKPVLTPLMPRLHEEAYMKHS